jgi:hypothetical protein
MKIHRECGSEACIVDLDIRWSECSYYHGSAERVTCLLNISMNGNQNIMVKRKMFAATGY